MTQRFHAEARIQEKGRSSPGRIFAAALFIRVPNWKQPDGPLETEWTTVLGRTEAMECDPGIRE